jgi:hypothetical protein
MPAVLALTFTVHIRFRRQIHDFNQLRPGGSQVRREAMLSGLQVIHSSDNP